MASILTVPSATAVVADRSNTRRVTFGAGTMLAIAPGAECNVWTSSTPAGPARPLRVGCTTTLMISTSRREACVEAGRAYTIYEERALCALLAFADISLDPNGCPHSRPQADVLLQSIPEGYHVDLGALKNWLVHEAMHAGDNSFLNHLRAREGYLITRYLLQAPEGSRVTTLCRQYGLSYTHFRRLCANALGGSTKRQLRAWRAARSALQLIDGRRSLLDVAIDNGYASSSHICRDIKQIYGVTPSTIMKAHVLLP